MTKYKQHILRVLFFLVISIGMIKGVNGYCAAYNTDSITTYKYTESYHDEVPIDIDTYRVKGWNILRYYYYQYYFIFSEYPWVVRMAYTIILGCILGFGLVLFGMIVDIYLTQRNRRFYLGIRKKYLEKMKKVCYEEVENLPTEEIVRRTEYKIQKWKDWQMRLWARQFVEICQFTNTSDPNLTNLQRLMEVVGFTDYVKRHLIFGSSKRKLKLLQAVRLTNMHLPDSIMTRLVNDKNPSLRKAARIYYMLSSEDDPFIFFEDKRIAIDSMKEANFSIWDRIELHEIFSKITSSGHSLPRFVPILDATENSNMKTFIMRETAYWGTDREVRYVTKYFNSEEFRYRKAAFESMGIRRFSIVEDELKELFYKQTEVLRRSILLTLLKMNTGRSIDFYVQVYQTPSSDYTRRTALYCLWLSGEKGKAVFTQLKNTAKEKDDILFKHVECPIINDESI